MSGLQILRFEGRADLNVRLVDHVIGRSRPRTAIDRSSQGIINIPIVDNYELAESAITLGRLAAKGRRGRKASHVLVDGVMGGPPPYEQRVDDNGDVIPGQPEPWSQEKIWRWTLRSTAWIRRTVEANGLAKLCFVALHQDETSPHLHFAFVPRCSDGRLSWTTLKKAVAGVSTHRNDHSKRTAATAMTALQDSYHERVARHFGLARGEPQSKTRRVHRAIDRVEAANREAEIVRARAQQEARQLAADAVAHVDSLQQEAQQRVIRAQALEKQSVERRVRIERKVKSLTEQKQSAEERINTLCQDEAELREQREEEERTRDGARAAQRDAEQAAAEATTRRQRTLVIIDAAEKRETDLRKRADTSLRVALDADQRRSVAADALVDLQEERAREETTLDEVRAARTREEQAAQAAQAAREHDEEIGGKWVVGRHARKGRELRERLESERGAAVREAISLRVKLRDTQEELATTTQRAETAERTRADVAAELEKSQNALRLARDHLKYQKREAERRGYWKAWREAWQRIGQFVDRLMTAMGAGVREQDDVREFIDACEEGEHERVTAAVDVLEQAFAPRSPAPRQDRGIGRW